MRTRLASLAREPLVQFLLMGFLIWCGVEFLKAHGDRRNHTIEVGPAEQQRILATYRQQFGEQPTPARFQELIDRYVREEIYLREGLALHLDKDDEIVRRRIAQKYEFLQSDLAVPTAPDSAALDRWFRENQDRYLTPARVAFSQIYFSPDKDGDAAARQRALEALKTLRATAASRAPGLGDAFPGPADAGALASEEAVRLFGESELSAALFDAPLARWTGPYRSGFGWHLIYVTGRSPPALPSLTDVRDRVLRDYMDEERRLLNLRAYEKLRAKYTLHFAEAPP